MHKGVEDVSTEGRSIHHVLVLAPHFPVRLIHVLVHEQGNESEGVSRENVKEVKRVLKRGRLMRRESEIINAA